MILTVPSGQVEDFFVFSDQTFFLDRPLDKVLDAIDFEAIADHWLARFSGYRRRECRGDL
jgi:hypothetical protein